MPLLIALMISSEAQNVMSYGLKKLSKPLCVLSPVIQKRYASKFWNTQPIVKILGKVNYLFFLNAMAPFNCYH